jgi:hypothetical protein
LPDERALTWLRLNLEKLGVATLALAVEPAAEPAPVTAMTSAAPPSNEATLRGVKDMYCLHSGCLWGPRLRRGSGRLTYTANLPQPQLVSQMP